MSRNSWWNRFGSKHKTSSDKKHSFQVVPSHDKQEENKSQSTQSNFQPVDELFSITSIKGDENNSQKNDTDLQMQFATVQQEKNRLEGQTARLSIQVIQLTDKVGQLQEEHELTTQQYVKEQKEKQLMLLMENKELQEEKKQIQFKNEQLQLEKQQIQEQMELALKNVMT